MKIILIGFRGSGKTSVGKTLAERMGFSFYDVDEHIQKAMGCSISALIHSLGWKGFRMIEKTMIRSLAGVQSAVIAPGGGAVLDEENRTLLSNEGSLVVWLQARPDRILERLQGDRNTQSQRPALTGLGLMEEVRSVLEKRGPLYQKWADLTVDTTDKTVVEVAEEVMEILSLSFPLDYLRFNTPLPIKEEE